MSNLEVIKKFKSQLADFITHLNEAGDERTSRLNNYLVDAQTQLKKTEKVLILNKPMFKLPPGFRSKMVTAVTEHLAEGRDYSGYAYEEAEYEAQFMDDQELYDQYYESKKLVIKYVIEDSMINTVEDILNKEKLMEVINE